MFRDMKLIAIALAAVLLAVPLATAEATTTIKLKRLVFEYDTPFSVCGVTGDYHLHILLRNYIAKLYDDGSYDLKAVHYVEFWNGGTLIATSPQTQFLSDEGHNAFNVLIHCESGQKDTNSHVVYTLEGGVITNLHYR